jgi:hypothetical protein
MQGLSDEGPLSRSAVDRVIPLRQLRKLRFGVRAGEFEKKRKTQKHKNCLFAKCVSTNDFD